MSLVEEAGRRNTNVFESFSQLPQANRTAILNGGADIGLGRQILKEWAKRICNNTTQSRVLSVIDSILPEEIPRLVLSRTEDELKREILLN